MSYSRYAIYYLPPPGPLADFGAGWLGWDIAAARVAERPDLPGLDAVTASPARYGFHATLKPPFRLAEGETAGALGAAVAEFAARCAPAQAAGLRLSRLGRFLALLAEGDATDLSRVAAGCVRDLDRFRAPASAAERDARRGKGLSERQEILLARWGYPHVMEEFRFHMTLTGPMPRAEIATWQEELAARLPPLPVPFTLGEVALVGERRDGFFETIHRFALTG